MYVRCQKHLFPCVTYYLHITSRWMDIGWNTVSHIWYIKVKLRNVASSEEKKKEKKKTETYVKLKKNNNNNKVYWKLENN